MQEIQLLKAIEQDARISVTDLADILNSTPEQVDGEMKKLAEEKVICGYHTVINWDKTNQDHVMALIEVNASPERDCGYDKVAEKIYRYPEVSNMYLISGRSEFIVIVKGGQCAKSPILSVRSWPRLKVLRERLLTSF